ncbi:MAG: histidine phosphatase family protein [Sphingomonadaceae bacterium]|nr:histidine phosphatase family protein [Sphingomonadaceae bacterium]
MKILGILRHAKSDWDDTAQRDFDRGLNGRGRKGAALIGAHIRDHGARWDALLASPAARVKQTLEEALPDIEPVWDERLYLASVTTIFDVIREHAGDADHVLISGHNPGLQEVLFELIPPENENELFSEAVRKFPTASFAVIEIDIDDWADLDGAKGKLAHFARPRDLDPELGPERAY